MTNRFRPHFRALRVAAALLAASPVISLLTAPAQALVVFDPKNYAQNLLSAARALVDRLPVPENDTTGERRSTMKRAGSVGSPPPKTYPNTIEHLLFHLFPMIYSCIQHYPQS